MVKYLTLCLVILTVGCKTFVLDTSMSAADANDATIIMSADGGMPSQGFDVFHVSEQSKIDSEWVIILPVQKKLVTGELRVRYKDRKFTFPLTDAVTRIKWRDIIGEDTWNAAHTGVAQVTAQLQFKSPDSDANYVDVIGYAFLRVHPKGYAPLPIGSELGIWEAKCKIEYSTNGRSAISCK